MAIAMACGSPAPKPDPKADPAVVAYSAPLVTSYVPSGVYERTYHGNFAYPYAAAPIVASAPYAAYTAPVFVRWMMIVMIGEFERNKKIVTEKIFATY